MKIITRIIMGVLFMYSTCAWSGVLSERLFTYQFSKKLAVEFPKSKFTIKSNLRIYADNINGYELNIFLDNTYNSYISKSRTLEEAFTDQINSIKNKQKPSNVKNLKNIIPVLKPKDYLSNARKQLIRSGYKKKGLPFYYEKLNSEIYILYVFDTPESMSFVSPEDIKNLKVKIPKIRDIAKSNLDNYFGKIKATISQMDTDGEGSIFVFEADRNYEASALLLPDVWDKNNIPINGEFVVFVPARDTLLIVGSKDKKGLKIAENIARRAYAELGYAISPYGFMQNNMQWVRYKP